MGYAGGGLRATRHPRVVSWAVATSSPVLTARFWRSRRSAAIAGIVFAVLLLTAMIMIRIAFSDDTLNALRADSSRRTLVRFSLQIVPFAGIAFLWFIGVVRDQMGDVEDRLFSTVFLGSGLLFLAMLFQSAVTTTSVMGGLTGPSTNVDLYEFGRSSTQTLISVYAMRMAGVFTLSVSTLALRTGALPRWIP